MAKDDTPILTPRLRFPEFRDAQPWATPRGDDLFDQVNNRNAPEGLPVLAITQEYGAVPRDQIDYHVSVTEKSVESYKEVCLGDFIISLRSFQGGIEFSDFHGICSPAYVILRQKTEDKSHFFRHLFKSRRFIQHMTRNLEGLRDGKMISYKQFSEVTIALPTPPEQQKIADCLTSLDELIAAQGRKVAALAAHKKGLMQQLFPREGETVPRLRFPEYQDEPDWEVTTLEQLVDIQSGGTPSKANPEFWNGSIPWVSAKDMKQFFLEDSEDHITDAALDDGAKLVPAETLLMLTRGMTLLKDIPVCVLRRDMSYNQDVKALRPKDGVNSLFLAFLLLGNKPRLLKMVDVAGHGTGKVNTDELKAFELVSPQPPEQQRIADCLSALDAQVAAETEKLAALKTHKQGLMQQLFPSPEGV